MCSDMPSATDCCASCHAACKAVAAGEFIARLGGDEFAVIAAEGPQPANAAALGERLLAAASDDIEIDGHHLRIGLSIGVAIYPDDGTDAKALVCNADAALYRAKAEGRGTIRFFEAVDGRAAAAASGVAT